jgi:hypothetical protein
MSQLREYVMDKETAIIRKAELVTELSHVQSIKNASITRKTELETELSHVQSIIGIPRQGMVMSADDIKLNERYWFVASGRIIRSTFSNDYIDTNRINLGSAFYDIHSAAECIEYRIIQHKLRMAQHKDGGCGRYAIVISTRGGIIGVYHGGDVNYSKVSFNTEKARDTFKHSHSDSELKLLIQGDY